MNNIEPWCISRQLWWGHQIPVWYGPDKKYFVAISENKAKEKAKIHYGRNVDLIQDEDVLDTWFSSALWTFSTLDWPNESYELKRFYPGDVLVTGFDIIFFWVARMMMMGSFFMKKSPFKDIYIHPLIRDEFGKKMSKSKGNIIDPLQLLDKYGADTLRFTLTALLNPGRDVKLSESRIKGYNSFTKKIWNAAKFLKMNECEFIIDLDYNNISYPTNRWIINELIEVTNSVNLNMKKYLFHEVANDLYHFIWHTYCDWYIEFIKSDLNDDTKKYETRKVSGWVFGQILKLIHPIMPFLSEKLWGLYGNNENFLMLEKFSKFDNKNLFLKTRDEIKLIINIVTSIRNLRSELNIPYKKSINLNINNKNKETNIFIKNFSNELTRFLKIKNLSFDKINKKDNLAYIVVKDTTLTVPLDGVIDKDYELNKLNEKKEKEQNKLTIIQNKLKNDRFLDKAPSHVIENFSLEADQIKSSIEKIDQIINTIS